MFFKQGLDGVSLEAVAAAAGVSRMTVYGHFGDKETLFAEVITAEAQAVGQALSDLSDRCAAAPGIIGLRDDLIAFGADLTAFLLRPDLKAFNRLLESQAPRHPELARAFVESGPRAVFRKLTERLRAACEEQVLIACDPANAARHLIGMFKSIETSATAVGLAPTPSRAEVERHVMECVDVLLRAYGGAPM